MSSDPRPDTAQIAGKIAARLRSEHFGSGSRAALRRIKPAIAADLAEPVLQRLFVDVEIPDHWLDARGMEDWGLIVHALSLGAPDYLTHPPKLGVGLHRADYSESRLTRLLQADRAQLTALLPRACRFLVAKGVALPATEIARFVCGVSSPDADRGALVRISIAQDFYRAARAISDAPQTITRD